MKNSKVNRYRREWRAARKAKGLCDCCPNRLGVSKILCDICLLKTREAMRKRKGCRPRTQSGLVGRRTLLPDPGQNTAEWAEQVDPETSKKRDQAVKRALRESYIVAGKCPICSGREPLLPGFKYGRKCRRRSSNDNKTKRTSRRACGLCTHCGKPATGKAYCDACLRQHSDLRKVKYHQRKAAGVCVHCEGKLATDSLIHCPKCQNRQRRYERNRSAKV